MMDRLIYGVIDLIVVCITCLFLAGAIDNAVHYDGFWSAFKICLGVYMAFRYGIQITLVTEKTNKPK